ncbi:dephospho-CoA kinase [Pelagibacterium halotolerans]|uniref:Dephospho-CoA kinase n=1 Tax=Pelagibacterium halotolerans (strain DSM 22347 / JCM 15775 / CGMCC 1.7692 / B2) TaxID=1082931 RepID=G4R7R1_PELHB|nr:dephospho-CoA kinase [Pelagibacterium halotolerans]AEQ53321.1 Dephospho-CoA kinase [Pelagibacterium halotolerans B2]QJR17065.1 dephospho-CoA kinase [Pelagibacterium halotolerans]SEA63063.1 dephospho-CoA kinase [Pelagibacterium halotolerans]
MLRVVLTGSIATGKSTVLARFAERGFPTYSADEAVHELYAGPAAALVETLFPGTVRDGMVDRKALSAAIAAEPDRIAELEEVIHPLVREKALDFMDSAEARGNGLAVVEIPLFFETGAKYSIDKVVAIHCDPEIQRRRVLTRPGMSGEKLDFILSRQLTQDEKRTRADYAIDTSGTMDDTIARTDAVIEALLDEARA